MDDWPYGQCSHLAFHLQLAFTQRTSESLEWGHKDMGESVSTGLMEDVVAELLMSIFLWIDVWRKSLQVWPLEIKTQNTHTDDSLLSQRNIDYICVSQFKAQPQKECTLCMSHESSSKAIVPRRKCEVGGSTRLFWRAIRWKRGGEENNKRSGEIYRGDGEGLWGNYTLKLLFNQLFSVPGY